MFFGMARGSGRPRAASTIRTGSGARVCTPRRTYDCDSDASDDGREYRRRRRRHVVGSCGISFDSASPSNRIHGCAPWRDGTPTTIYETSTVVAWGRVRPVSGGRDGVTTHTHTHTHERTACVESARDEATANGCCIPLSPHEKKSSHTFGNPRS